MSKSKTGASVLIRNARIYLFDENESIADAIFLEGGRVAAVGAERDLLRAAGASVESWNVNGATILPGLIDTHPHLLHFSAQSEPLID
jgi:predicted amidohydrolase YtcJ